MSLLDLVDFSCHEGLELGRDICYLSKHYGTFYGENHTLEIMAQFSHIDHLQSDLKHSSTGFAFGIFNIGAFFENGRALHRASRDSRCSSDTYQLMKAIAA